MGPPSFASATSVSQNLYFDLSHRAALACLSMKRSLAPYTFVGTSIENDVYKKDLSRE